MRVCYQKKNTLRGHIFIKILFGFGFCFVCESGLLSLEEIRNYLFFFTELEPAFCFTNSGTVYEKFVK